MCLLRAVQKKNPFVCHRLLSLCSSMLLHILISIEDSVTQWSVAQAQIDTLLLRSVTTVSIESTVILIVSIAE